MSISRTSISEVIHEHREPLVVGPRSLSLMRRTVAGLVRNWGWGEVADKATMCVAEMLSNVHQHVESGDCVLTLQSTSSSIRIVLSDSSPELPVVSDPDWDSESGRGMFLLSKTADAWGADPKDSGKDVWIEFHASEGRGAT
ncbi:ATP-binding protein [Streptomyces sp. NPDC051561]|uniref:ATP-binding protein n=1 Tax=Streptomyces sp. NPDC051561 TaxID=3365658 RepID=UPI0037A79E3F